MTASINTGDISKENYSFIQQHVYKTCGIVLDENKQYLLEARLLPIVRKENLRSINDLCALIRATSAGRVSQEVVEAMTTNETLFFRDAIPFKVMRQNDFPLLWTKKKPIAGLPSGPPHRPLGKRPTVWP